MRPACLRSSRARRFWSGTIILLYLHAADREQEGGLYYYTTQQRIIPTGSRKHTSVWKTSIIHGDMIHPRCWTWKLCVHTRRLEMQRAPFVSASIAIKDRVIFQASKVHDLPYMTRTYSCYFSIGLNSMII